MALTFHRKYFEGSLAAGPGFSTTLPESDTVRYIVPGNAKADILADLDLAAVTAPGTPHPDSIPGLTFASMNIVERIGSGTESGWIVDVVYARNRLSGGGVAVTPPDRTSQFYRLDSTSSRIEEIEIPLVAKQAHEFYLPFGGTITAYTFKRFSIKQTLPRTQYTLELNTNTFGPSDVYAIQGQTGKIHQFGGSKWLFQGGSMDEQEEGVYSITYTWLNDPGTPEVTIPDVPGSDTTYLVTPARGPFQSYVVRPYQDDSGYTQIEIVLVGTYEEDLTGWLSLPANPSF